MFNVVGIEKGTDNKIIIEPNMTEPQAMKMCESWGWSYDDGVKSYYMDIEEVSENEAKINEEVETMATEITREEIIEKVKELGITQNELGFRDYEAEAIQLRESCRLVSNRYYELIEALRELIKNCEIDPETAREYVPVEYWDEVGISENKYKVVEVTLIRRQYKKVYVVLGDDQSTYDAEDKIDLYEASDYDSDDEDEGDWEIDDTEVEDYSLSYDDVVNQYTTVNDIDEIEFE